MCRSMIYYIMICYIMLCYTLLLYYVISAEGEHSEAHASARGQGTGHGCPDAGHQQ